MFLEIIINLWITMLNFKFNLCIDSGKENMEIKSNHYQFPPILPDEQKHNSSSKIHYTFMPSPQYMMRKNLSDNEKRI